MNLEKEFKNLIIKANKVIFLKKKDKELMRSQVVAFMKQHPRENNVPVRASFSWFGFKVNKPILQYASMASVAVLLFGYVAYAAQGSLPGDPLYSVKVGVNEKVAGFFLASDKSKAQYEVQLAKMRLEEIEKVAVEGKSNEKTDLQVTSLLNDNIENVKKYSDHIKSKDEVDALEINSDLEASLNAHSQVLNKLENVKKILSDVNDKTNKIKKERQDDEGKLDDRSQALKSSAEGKLNATTAKVKEVNSFVEKKKSSINEEAYNLAKANLLLANEAIVQGQQELQAGNWRKAFSLFQQAIRMAQETQITIKTSISLKLDLPKIQIKIEDEGQGTNGENDNEKQGQQQEKQNKEGVNIKDSIKISD